MKNFALGFLLAALVMPSNAQATYGWEARLVQAVESVASAIKDNTRACR